jgi:hypothetical protein
VRRNLATIVAATVLVFGVATVAAEPATACSLHIVYTLYPYADDYPYTTTSYTVYRYFVTHNLGVARYGWYC